MIRCMKILTCFLFAALICLYPTGAQAGGWGLSVVDNQNPDYSVAGYIYHYKAVGKERLGNKSKSVISGVRLVCSNVLGDSPIIAVFWQGLAGNSVQQVDIRINSKKIKSVGPWFRDGPVIYRKLSETEDLIQKMSKAEIMELRWLDNSVERITTVELKNFEPGFGDFKKNCRESVK